MAPKKISVRRSVISIEPAFIAHTTSIMMCSLLVNNIILGKACGVNLKIPKTTCDHILNADSSAGKSFSSSDSIALQQLAVEVFMVKNMLENVFPIILVFLIGPWTDKYGCKSPIMIVIASFICHNLLFILDGLSSGIGFGAWTMAIWTTLVVSLCGSQQSLMISMYSYINRSVNPDKMTLRTGITQSSYLLGMILGLKLNGLLLDRNFSMSSIFMFGVLLESFALVYFHFMMTNDPSDEVLANPKSFFQSFKDIFHCYYLGQSLHVVFQVRQGGKRKKLFLYMLLHICSMMPMYGESTISYLFYRVGLSWSDKVIADYTSFKAIMGFTSNILSTLILTSLLNLSDPICGIIASLSHLGGSIAQAWATDANKLLWTAQFISIMSGPLYAIPRSGMSQLVQPSEIGKVNSVMTSLECIISLFAGPLYTIAYEELENQSFFIISALFMMPSIIIFGWLVWEKRRENQNQQQHSD